MGNGKWENNAFDHINDLHANTSIKNRAKFCCICPVCPASDVEGQPQTRYDGMVDWGFGHGYGWLRSGTGPDGSSATFVFSVN